MPIIVKHPWGFFLPDNSRLLMLGSFPPPEKRWSMDFYYPNIQNDMWRIIGVVFYNDKNFFLETDKSFSKEKAVHFCLERGIALGDTVEEAIMGLKTKRTNYKNAKRCKYECCDNVIKNETYMKVDFA